MASLDFPAILAIAFGLSADCFAVAFGGSCSLKHITVSQTLRLSFSFGFFQAVMPVLGWLLGRSAVNLVAPYDHWLAFGLLLFVGGRMVWEFFKEQDEIKTGVDITRGVRLVVLSIATSIDALAVGLTFAFLKVNVVVAAGLIGTVSCIVTAVGFGIGCRAGRLLGKWAELAGGVVLIGIGLRVLLEHLAG